MSSVGAGSRGQEARKRRDSGGATGEPGPFPPTAAQPKPSRRETATPTYGKLTTTAGQWMAPWRQVPEWYVKDGESEVRDGRKSLCGTCRHINFSLLFEKEVRTLCF